MLEALDAAAVGSWSRTAAESLEAHQVELDALNVFPVADGDTGTNLAVTVRAGADALAAADTGDVAAALDIFACGCVLAARGNSGVIVSQYLRGLAQALAGSTRCGSQQLGAALRMAAEQARAAVADPVDGTILSVAHAAAGAAGPTLPELIRAVVQASATALARTPHQLPVLARNGVVDAGGRGLLVLLDALARTITGEPSSLAAGPSGSPSDPRPAHERASSTYVFEVQYLLEAADAAIGPLRAALSRLGDSVAVVGTGSGVWNVHAHVNDVGGALEAGVEAGRPYRITVVRLDDGAPEMRDGAGSSRASMVVAIAPGEGLAHLFLTEGVLVVDDLAGQPPTAVQVAEAVRGSCALEVVLLPNITHDGGVAEAAAEHLRAAGIRAAVVPTRSAVQGLAALAVHNPAGRFDDNVVAMAEAAAATRFAEVRIAHSQALTSAGICEPGDVLGLIDGDVVEIGRGLVSVAFALIDRLLGVGAELITVLVGAGAGPGHGEVIAGHVRDRAPLTDVTVYAGGQLDQLLIIGVE